ncbi:unnamed protein product [Blepharisma stoltei]|uniref:non-specific serine/threonine protein kinase n=1 Tax=Blepharisma stoltei TaxID=1481888 RepID=A0AAU9KBS4_9CILI|nr:unnamed protein product [Blepharisma stoltei]
MVDQKDAYFSSFTMIKDISRKSTKTIIWIVQFKHYQENLGFPRTAVMKRYNEASNRRIEKEALILEYVGRLHNNIVKIYHHMIIGGKFTIFMETCSKDSIAYMILQNNGREVWNKSQLIKNFITVSEVLAYLHLINIVHRDIKPDNIFVCEDDEWKIGDFGGAKKLIKCNEPNTVAGTELYMSPFLIEKYNLKIPKSDDIDPKKEDVYSLGKTFYEIASMSLYEKFPQNETQSKKQVRRGMLGHSKELISIVLSMLAHNPIKRPSMKEVWERLRELQEAFAKLEYSEIQDAMPVEEEKSSAREANMIINVNSILQSTIEGRRPAMRISDYYASSSSAHETETVHDFSGNFTLEEFNDYFSNGMDVEENSGQAERLNGETLVLNGLENLGISQSYLHNGKVRCSCGLEVEWEEFESYFTTCLSFEQNATDICCNHCGNRYPQELIQKITQ